MKSPAIAASVPGSDIPDLLALTERGRSAVAFQAMNAHAIPGVVATLAILAGSIVTLSIAMEWRTRWHERPFVSSSQKWTEFSHAYKADWDRRYGRTFDLGPQSVSDWQREWDEVEAAESAD